MGNVTKFAGAALAAGSLAASQPASAQYYWAPRAYYYAYTPPAYYYDPSGAIVAGMALGVIGAAAAAAASQYAYPYPYTYARPWIGCVAPWRCW